MDFNKCIEAWRFRVGYALNDSHLSDLFHALHGHNELHINTIWREINEVTFASLTKPDGTPWNVFDGYDPARDMEFLTLRIRFIESFQGLSHFNHISAVRTGLTRALESVYEDISPLYPEFENFLNTLPQQISPHQLDRSFFRRFFSDSMMVNRASAILHCEEQEYPLVSEVKGLTNAVITQVLENLSGTKATYVRPILGAPTSTGSSKDSARHEQTRQACETVRTEIVQGKHGFLVNGEYKTNQEHFRQAVQAVLGTIKPRRDTVREEWGKVPQDIKHIGRVPDQ